MNVEEYEQRLKQRVGEAEYGRHKELVRLLARNLALEDILWEEILVCIRDVNARTELLRQRNTIVKDIHTEFRALNIEVPTTVEKNTEAFASFLGDLSDEGKPKESKQPADRKTWIRIKKVRGYL